ncbi:hypothetical protein [Streptomyces milbemycinicus]|uniref:competence protein CoiA family protein n=1 Tax=Streptomyces milbemycinicus TaxID=476552 RepID=UPI0033EFF010
MAFRAVHAQWGTIFAHLPDLGCAQSWEAVWKARPSAPIVCDECRHPMHAKTSRAGLRFFTHAPGAPTCALGLESVAHHLLKLELAAAARDAGAHAELEVPGPGGAWRADVLATDPTEAWKTALEAQLAPITNAGITDRTERMRADGVTSIWFSDRPRPPWLGTVPSIRLATEDTREGLLVAEGLVKFHGRGWKPVPASLTDFLAWTFARRVVPHTPRTPLWYPQRALPTVWTAPHYITAETAHLEEEERQRRIREARPRRQAAPRAGGVFRCPRPGPAAAPAADRNGPRAEVRRRSPASAASSADAARTDSPHKRGWPSHLDDTNRRRTGRAPVLRASRCSTMNEEDACCSQRSFS